MEKWFILHTYFLYYFWNKASTKTLRCKSAVQVTSAQNYKWSIFSTFIHLGRSEESSGSDGKAHFVIFYSSKRETDRFKIIERDLFLHFHKTLQSEFSYRYKVIFLASPSLRTNLFLLVPLRTNLK